MQSSLILNQPSDALYLIFNNLPPNDLLNCAKTCRLFNIHASNQIIWKKLLRDHFPNYFKKITKSEVNFKAEYIKAARKEYKSLDKEMIELMTMVKSGEADKIANFKFANCSKSLNYSLLVKDSNGLTIFDWANKLKNQNVLNSLFHIIQKALATLDLNGNRKFLEFAIMCNQSFVILLRCSNSVSAENLPIALAAKFGKEFLVKYMLHKGADINSEDLFGLSPLCMAVESGNENMVRFLIDNHADLSPDPTNNITRALDIAVQLGRTSIVKLLIESGARFAHYKPNTLQVCARAVEDETMSPLELQQNEPGIIDEVVELCLRNAKFDILVNFKKHAIHIDLKNNNGVSNYFVSECIVGGNIDHFNALIELGIDVNTAIHDNGLTPLIVAVVENKIDMVARMMEAGAQPLTEIREHASALRQLFISKNTTNLCRINEFLAGFKEDEIITVNALELSRLMGHDRITNILGENVRSLTI